MKRLFVSFVGVLLGFSSSLAATSPRYINNAPLIVPPQIDATEFINRSTFSVTTTLPFQGQHVLYWTNSGVMNGNPGFWFEFDSG